MRLKDRNRGVPGSFQLLLPEIAMSKPLKGTFSSIVESFSKIVAKNPALAAKQGWPTNREDQENWIDQRECQRLVAGGYFKFVEMESSLPPPAVGGWSRSPSVGGAVAEASKTLTGIAIWNDMFHGAEPVAIEEADRRATICETCPKNQRGGFKEFFVAAFARGLTELVGLLNDRKLTTSKDKELGTCAACLCPLQPKCFVPLEIIKRHMPASDVAKLDVNCWITHDKTP